MALLILCIFANAYIGVAFKYFAQFKVRTLQAIVVNYFVCVVTASAFMGAPAINESTFHAKWLPHAVGLGFLFVVIFFLYAKSVEYFGVVLSTIFQKMSLVAPAAIAIIYFNEDAGWVKLLGIAFAIASIFIITGSARKKIEDPLLQEHTAVQWLFPVGTLLGSCMIDGGLFVVNANEIASSTDIGFVATLFFFAGCAGVVLSLIQYFNNGKGYRLKELIAGIALGVPNFFSIFLLLKVLSNGMDGSVVFPINNVGILVVSAIVGIFLFRESFNRRKMIGFTIALLSILMIAYGQS